MVTSPYMVTDSRTFLHVLLDIEKQLKFWLGIGWYTREYDDNYRFGKCLSFQLHIVILP